MGRSLVGVTTPGEGKSVSVAQGAPGTTTLKAGLTGLRHRVDAMLLTLSADGTIQFTSDDTPITGAMDVAGKGGFSHSGLGNLIETAPGAALKIVTTGGAAKGVVRVNTEV